MADGIELSEGSLDAILSGNPDLGRLRIAIREGGIPADKRADVWKILLGVNGKPDALSGWDGALDLKNQQEVKEECSEVTGRLLAESDKQDGIARDAECLVTFFCKARAVRFEKGNGWVETVIPFLCLGMSKADAYNCLYAMLSKYIPRECCLGGTPFQIFRLLLLYHEPDLCSFLDTKRLHVETYLLKWIRSLFVTSCPIDVIFSIWDEYLTEGDPFLVFFLALVMILNAKELIMEEKSRATSELIESISSFPSELSADDIEDFCGLAKYYELRTSSSFRRDYYSHIFGLQRASSPLRSRDFSTFLCLPVSAKEVVESLRKPLDEPLKYFVVDCRPEEQFRAGHLSESFHLDVTLMLQSPEEFAARLAQLFVAHKQGLLFPTGSAGDHICCLGSGRQQEDQYTNMVISHLLQRNVKNLSIVKGGYSGVYQLSIENEDLVDVVGTDHKAYAHSAPSSAAATSEDESRTGTPERSHGRVAVVEKVPSLVWKLSSAIKEKSAKMKMKIKKWIADTEPKEERHVSQSDRASRSSLYRGVKPIFSIDDEEELEDGSFTSSDDESRREAINLDTWRKRVDVIQTFPCNELTMSGSMHPSHLLLTKSHMFVLREISSRRGWAVIQSRQLLTSVVKITSKKKHPDVITFKFGAVGEEGETTVTGRQRFIIPKAQKATKLIKDAILSALDGEDV